MKKIVYLRFSQKEANLKIWNSIIQKYKTISQKSIIFAYLYIPFGCILFGIIAIFGWFSSISMLCKDIRFTPHYMQTIIEHNNMTLEEANMYLNSQLNEYKKSCSYGNFSPTQRDTIDTTFELLLEKYKLPELNNEIHEALISGLFEIKGSIESNAENLTNIYSKVDFIHDNVEIIGSKLEPISSYTIQKKQEETALLAEKECKHYKQPVKQVLGNNLKDWQINLLTECINEAGIFVNVATHLMVKQIFTCTLKEPVRLNNYKNRLLAYLFYNLYSLNLIPEQWQSICGKNELFISFKGTLLTKDDLASASFQAKENPPKDSIIIDNYLKQLKKR